MLTDEIQDNDESSLVSELIDIQDKEDAWTTLCDFWMTVAVIGLCVGYTISII